MPTTTPGESFVLASGCFWCAEAAYRVLEGVIELEAGYTGGTTENPRDYQIATGATGHAEAVKVTFDPQVLPQRVLLEVFFAIHDPTQLNRQGNDVGTHVRSAMFWQNQHQRELFASAIDSAKSTWGPGVVTELTPLQKWWPAEEHHQNFFAKNPENAYCQIAAVPKMSHVRTSFPDYLATAGAGGA